MTEENLKKAVTLKANIEKEKDIMKELNQKVVYKVFSSFTGNTDIEIPEDAMEIIRKKQKEKLAELEKEFAEL